MGPLEGSEEQGKANIVPRYFYNVADGSGIVDDTGIELPDIDAARKMAVAFAGEAMRDHAAFFEHEADWHLNVTSDDGQVILTLRFHAAAIH